MGLTLGLLMTCGNSMLLASLFTCSLIAIIVSLGLLFTVPAQITPEHEIWDRGRASRQGKRARKDRKEKGRQGGKKDWKRGRGEKERERTREGICEVSSGVSRCLSALIIHDHERRSENCARTCRARKSHHVCHGTFDTPVKMCVPLMTNGMVGTM